MTDRKRIDEALRAMKETVGASMFLDAIRPAGNTLRSFIEGAALASLMATFREAIAKKRAFAVFFEDAPGAGIPCPHCGGDLREDGAIFPKPKDGALR